VKELAARSWQLSPQERFESGQQSLGKYGGAFGRGMNAIGLDGAGYRDQVFVDHGHEGDARVGGGESVEELLKGSDIVRPVVGRQRDAGEQDSDVRSFERGQDLIKIAASLVERKAAKTVVAAEFDDDVVGMQRKNLRQPGDGVFGGGAAGASIQDFVAVAFRIEIALKKIGIRLAVRESIAGGDAVAIADQQARVGSGHRLYQGQQEDE
jgi:hypothetical protein